MKIKAWIYAARPKTLAASIVPIICAIIIMPNFQLFNFNIFILTITSAIIIQIITNYINDLYDFLKGADSNRIGPKRMIQSGLLSKNEITLAIKLLFILAILSGLPLVLHGGWPILFIGLSAFLFAYLYTAGPLPLAYHGLGDLFVFIYFGLAAVMGSYYLQTGFIDYNSIWLGISIGSKNVLLLIINNIRDYQGDKNVNKKTLIVQFGKKFGYLQAICMIALSYIGILFLSLGLNNIIIFYISMMSMPLSINIFYDVYIKEGGMLNKTLGKVIMLLCLDTGLLGIGVFL
tara:strand:+ start:364 stop:1233 length:870 start_codon:yes stop_codon:yes gene_type:complete